MDYTYVALFSTFMIAQLTNTPIGVYFLECLYYGIYII